MATYFRDWAEIETRTSFDPRCGIAPDDVTSLVGEYHIAGDEERPCQAVRNGTRCEEPHKNGWLGCRRLDGKEALIGQTCGIKYFKASTTFQAERNRIRRELSIDSYIERLKTTLGNPEYAADFERTRARLRAVRDEVQELEQSLPPSVVKRVTSMARANDPAVEVQFRFNDIEEDANGKPIITWQPEQIGSLQGLAIWDVTITRSVFAILNDVRQTMGEARIDREAGERNLKRWADQLAELGPAAARVVDLERALESFSSVENLQLLCLTVANQTEALQVARLALERDSDRRAMEAGPQRLYNHLCARVRERRGGRPFRIVW